jgi:transposase
VAGSNPAEGTRGLASSPVGRPACKAGGTGSTPGLASTCHPLWTNAGERLGSQLPLIRADRPVRHRGPRHSAGRPESGSYPRRTGEDFLRFLRKAVRPHRGKQIHVVLDNRSTHDTPEVRAWLDRNPHVTFHFTPVGSSWLHQIEIWFGIITRQSIRRGTFASVTVLIAKIRAYIDAWNADAKPFTWTATVGEILAKVRLVQTNIKQLVDNNAK